jgi:hypothetical protein
VTATQRYFVQTGRLHPGQFIVERDMRGRPRLHQVKTIETAHVTYVHVGTKTAGVMCLHRYAEVEIDG